MLVQLINESHWSLNKKKMKSFTLRYWFSKMKKIKDAKAQKYYSKIHPFLKSDSQLGWNPWGLGVKM